MKRSLGASSRGSELKKISHGSQVGGISGGGWFQLELEALLPSSRFLRVLIHLETRSCKSCARLSIERGPLLCRRGPSPFLS